MEINSLSQCSLICIPSIRELEYFKSFAGNAHSSIFYLTSDEEVKEALESQGTQGVMLSSLYSETILCEREFSRIILLEHSLLTTSLLLSALRNSLNAPITVVTRFKAYPSELYRRLGAKYVIYSNSNKISFLVQ
ncbi:hypothetical protein [Metabacillus mangrovi]|uniref:hypothetical protein n=1 Tax=Metabacillus mangrovi TaxID=1491830 RepID=UPI001F4FCBA4|nr:hypothetical protein [Metabacillus mangrovi]